MHPRKIKTLSLGLWRTGRETGEGGGEEGGVNSHNVGYTNLLSLHSSYQQGSGQRVLLPKGAYLVSSRPPSTVARVAAP